MGSISEFIHSMRPLLVTEQGSLETVASQVYLFPVSQTFIDPHKCVVFFKFLFKRKRRVDHCSK